MSDDTGDHLLMIKLPSGASRTRPKLTSNDYC
jgi:hypothetical protein